MVAGSGTALPGAWTGPATRCGAAGFAGPGGTRSPAGDGARGTTRGARRANARAELHECLIEVTRSFRGDQRARDRAQPLRGGRRGVEDATENAPDVAIDSRLTCVECNARHSARGVVADSGKRAQRGV